jgi:hypothetical protein
MDDRPVAHIQSRLFSGFFHVMKLTYCLSSFIVQIFVKVAMSSLQEEAMAVHESTPGQLSWVSAYRAYKAAGRGNGDYAVALFFQWMVCLLAINTGDDVLVGPGQLDDIFWVPEAGFAFIAFLFVRHGVKKIQRNYSA